MTLILSVRYKIGGDKTDPEAWTIRKNLLYCLQDTMLCLYKKEQISRIFVKLWTFITFVVTSWELYKLAETLRMYPPATILLRRAMSNYTFDGTKVSIPKGNAVWIPVFGIHRNPDIYPNPDSFDPERFNEDAVAARHPMHYLPFGDGPRNCIGARFAVYQTKIGLVTILRNYKVDVCEKTMIPYEFHPASAILAPNGGIYLKITKLQS